MANKTIENLDALDINNYNPDEDLLIVQKPNGATYHMSATNIMNPVAGGIVHLDEEVSLFTGIEEGEVERVISLSDYVPSTASTAIISAIEPERDETYCGYPHLQVTWFNNSSFSGRGHFIRVNANDRGNHGGVQFMCPIIDRKIYLKIRATGTRAGVVLNAYM